MSTPERQADEAEPEQHASRRLGGMLVANKSFYISELSLNEASQHVCFMPEQTVTTTTGVDFETEQTIPAQTWNQLSQELAVVRVTAVIGKSRVAVDATCLGDGKLDTETGLQVLKFRQVGNLSAKSKTGRPTKLGGGDVQVRIECDVMPQP